MEQAQFDIQLKVWKELAISKQMLIRAAAETLKLDPDCTQDEIKNALDNALAKVKEAETSVAKAKEQARQDIAAIEKRLNDALKAQTAAEKDAAEARAAQEKAIATLASERAAIAKELQQLKERAADKDKALKAINSALADTPDNVVKKLKSLKKEKQDEADARRAVELSLGTLRKEKQDQDKQLSDLRDNTTKLVSTYRGLHETTTQLHEQLKPLVEATALPALPELDSKLLDSIEKPEGDKSDEKKSKK